MLSIKMRLLIFILSVALCTKSEKVSYQNYKVFQVTLTSEREYQLIMKLMESNKHYDYWSTHIRKNNPIDIMVAPGYQQEFTNQMEDSHIKYKLTIENIQTLIDHGTAEGKREQHFNWKRYQTLDEIYDWLDSLPKKHPGKVKVIIGGRTYEGRKIKGVKISFKENNPGIFIEGGIHANEWIAPATVTYLINEFLTSSNPKVRSLAESHDWYIFPSCNPDGYVYTHTTNRMWRKSISRATNSDCIGVDLNRNWDYMWMVVGASTNPCSNQYAGSSAFSEIETRTMSKFLKSIEHKLFAYLDFHSYSQYLMLPYGHTTEHLDNYNNTYAIGLKAINALASKYGTQYSIGNIAEIIYPASGSSMDWVKATLKLPMAFAFELRDQGHYGMLLPPEQIIPTGQEVLDSLIAMFEEARKFGYSK